VSTNPGFGIPEVPETPEMLGVPDVAKLMERLHQQQEEVERIQRGVEAMEVTGGSRDEEVRVTVRGNGQVTRVTIDSDALRQHDADEFGDIVMEAVNDALRKAAEARSARFRPVIEAASQPAEF
jgi:nucleoid-associated protein EbfC